MSDCGCVYVESDECYEFVNKTFPKARKQHKCDECGRIIKPGEKYELFKGGFEGRVETNKTCMDCMSVVDSFYCDGRILGDMWGYLEEHIREMDGQISSDCLTDLTPTARERVCEIIERVWRENDRL
jgi:hypothetical protein